MNRSKAPKTEKEIKIDHIEPVVVKLNNSIPLYMINTGSQPVVRIDIIFKAGSWWQNKIMVASSTITMLSEGTKNNTGEEIARTLDYCGAYLNTSSDRDNAFITIYSLSKYVNLVLPLLADIVKIPSFPEHEFQTYKERRKQSFIIERNKVNYLAREKFNLALYGSKHPYGQTLSLSDFENISRQDLIDFHSGYFHSGNCKIIISGKFIEKELAGKIDEHFGNSDWSATRMNKTGSVRKRSSSKKQIFIQKNDALQSAIRIGRELICKTHPDYNGMMVLNCILGGHFGSRLMQNIREKKGYTYGIGSALVTLRNSGYFVIVSEVGTGYQKPAIKEIYRELNKLRIKPVSRNELELARNHMLGEVLRGFDGPFAWSESLRNLIEHEMDTGFYHNLIHTIRNIGPAKLQKLANKYLEPEIMYEVLAGKK